MGNHREGRLLFIKNITPLFIGSSEIGVIDKPLQRDHLGLPIIFSSSLKGALRRQIDLNNDEKTLIFGSSPEEAGEEKNPGNIAFLDARPLFVPARSLIGTYLYITSPLLLRKLKEYSEIIGLNLNINLDNIKIDESKAILLNEGNRNISEKEKSNNTEKVYINEFEFTLDTKDTNIPNNLNNSIDEIITLLGLKDEPIVLISDERIVDVVDKSTIKYWRNRLEMHKKVTVRGGLWSEEYMPDGTVFVSGFVKTIYKASQDTHNIQNNKDNNKDLVKILDKKLNKSLIFIGGLESIGKGLVVLYTYPQNENSK